MLHWGPGRRFVRWAPTGTPAQLAANAVIGAMTVTPDAARQTLIYNLVNALMTGANPTWAKLDLLYVIAAHDSQAARLNWMNPAAFNLTAVNSPAFVADRGYTGGSTARLDTGWNPVTAGGVFAQDSAHIGGWCNTTTGTSTGYLMRYSTANLFIQPQSSGTTASYIVNGTTSTLVTSADSAAYFLAIRRDAANQILFRNASSSSAANVSTAVNSSNLNLLNAPTGSAPFPGQASVIHAGSQLSDAEVTALNAALATYRTGVGL